MFDVSSEWFDCTEPCRVPVHCFRVVQPPRTFSNHFSAEKERCVEVFDVSSEWFDCTEPCRVPVHCFRVVQPPRTFSNHFSAEKERCVEVFDVSSEWFDCTEPSQTSSSIQLCWCILVEILEQSLPLLHREQLRL